MKRLLPILLAMAWVGVSGFSGTMGLPVVPSNGGVGTMTSAPMWTRYFGDGSDGAGPASGAIATTRIKFYTSWHATGAISTGQGELIFSQGAVNLDTGSSIISATGGGTTGDFGGPGGSGGSGAGNSGQASGVNFIGSVVQAGGAASSAGAGNPGTALSAENIRSFWLIGPDPRDIITNSFNGGGAGTQGGSTGGVRGNGGWGLIIVAPSITVASGVTVNTAGFPGVQAAANSTGAGGGGGGGGILLITESLTDNGGIYNYAGGPPGMCQQPSIQVGGEAGSSSGCDTGTNGCGTGAILTLTGLTTGGLDATKITITNGGSGYQSAPSCIVNAGTSGLTGSPACHFTISAGAINSVVIDTPGSGGTLTSYTTCFVGGYGANAFMKELTIQ